MYRVFCNVKECEKVQIVVCRNEPTCNCVDYFVVSVDRQPHQAGHILKKEKKIKKLTGMEAIVQLAYVRECLALF